MIFSAILEIAELRGWIFPLKYPICYSALDGQDLGEAQNHLRVVAFINQDGICPICQQELKNNEKLELHHALVSKRDVQGMINPYWIHDSRNVLLLHTQCHINAYRGKCFEELNKIFSDIEAYLDNLPMKIELRKLRNTCELC